MYKISSKLLFSRNWVLISIVFACLWVPAVSSAQQPTATISALSGEVFVSETIPAQVGAILRPGDMIRTRVGASAVVKFSDGSRLEIGERTRIDIVKLDQKPLTRAQISCVKLRRGLIRAADMMLAHLPVSKNTPTM